MKRYLSLYYYFLKFSFSKAFEFRVDFTFRIFMDVIFYVVNIYLFKILLLHTPIIAGWNQEEMMVFITSFLLVDAINMTLLSTNMWWLPQYINKGDLDYYLVRPVSPLFFLSLREFAANSFLNLILAVTLFSHSLMEYSLDWTIGELCLYLLLLFNGVFLYYLIQLLMILPVFWTQSARGYIDLFYTLGLAMERPDRIFKGSLRVLFTTLLPFSLIASFPSRIFLEKFQLEIFLHILVVTIILALIVFTLWKRGLKNYSSASS